MKRLDNLNMQFRGASRSGKPTGAPRGKPTLDVWESMHLDQFMRPSAAEKRKATGRMMAEIRRDLEPHVEATTFPSWVIDKIKPLGINGIYIKGYGSAELSMMESGAMAYEMAKVDGSISTFYLVHNAIGMCVISELGDEEQKQRFLPKGMSFDKIFCFGLTEP